MPPEYGIGQAPRLSRQNSGNPENLLTRRPFFHGLRRPALSPLLVVERFQLLAGSHTYAGSSRSSHVVPRPSHESQKNGPLCIHSQKRSHSSRSTSSQLGLGFAVDMLYNANQLMEVYAEVTLQRALYLKLLRVHDLRPPCRATDYFQILPGYMATHCTYYSGIQTVQRGPGVGA